MFGLRFSALSLLRFLIYHDYFMEITLTGENFEAEVLKSEVPVLVDFWAPWCGPCKMIGPIVHELAEGLDASKAKVGKVNVDEQPELSSKYGVMSIPTLVVFKGGKEEARTVGVQSKEELAKMLGL